MSTMVKEIKSRATNLGFYCERTNMKYEVIDAYDGYPESLGVFDTKQEAKKQIREQERDTDGECYCYIIKVKD